MPSSADTLKSSACMLSVLEGEDVALHRMYWLFDSPLLGICDYRHDDRIILLNHSVDTKDLVRK